MVKLLRILVVYSAFNLQFFTADAQEASCKVLTTFTNPTPASSDYFSHSLTAVGSDSVLVGAWQDDTGATDAGAAYLFRTDGTLLTTFTNPAPHAGDYFGWSVAAVGSDRVLIGAERGDTGPTNTGVAYLFNTSGVLLTTFTNPTPFSGDSFGFSVAAMGDDRVLIGATRDNKGALTAGVAYLFSTNGALLTTFTNPTPADFENFGFRVAAVGSSSLLIGSPHSSGFIGEAYLFSPDGTLVRTFTNPTPVFGDNFGISIAVLGGDRVLIGAHGDDTGGNDAGAAYLFSTNGALLTTFTNPSPATSDVFGASVVAVGDDGVLIGAYQDDTGASNAGTAYLFSANGALLITLTNPTPAFDDRFGFSVAAVGTDQLVVGAYQDDTGATNAGAAYLFSLVTAAEPPSLTIQITTTNTVAVSWPSPGTDWTLQENTNGVSSVNWSNAPGPIQDDGTNKTLIVDPPTGNRFYRLHKP